uniref:Amidohydrolase n=1 Tax=Eiseniibacteriota bacterium TaxID=2212470 RepID=A0A832I6M8_UNCEI
MPLSAPAARAARRAAGAALAALALAACPPTDSLAATPRVHALVNARIVTAPGSVIPRGTVVVRDGLIEAVGANVRPPADARIWDAESLTVYPGLIDAFVVPAEAARGPGAPAAAPAGPPRRADTDEPARGAVSALRSVTPEARVVEGPPLAREQVEALRAAGFAAAHVAPRRGIVRGQSALVGLGDASPNASVIRPDVSQVVSIEALPQGYPGSLMGGIAVIRQTFADAAWYRDVQAAHARRPGAAERPEANVSLEALQPAVAGVQPVTFVADEMLEVLRAAALAREAGVAARVVGAGDEYKRAAEIAATRLPLVVPVNFPEAPDASSPDDALEVATEQLRHWQQAPGNAAALSRAGASFALTAHGLRDAKRFRAHVARAVRRGLKPAEALAAVTTVPAAMLGVADRLGTIAPGRIANLTVTRGELFSEDGEVREVWVDGVRHEAGRDEGAFAGTWDLRGSGAALGLAVATEPDTVVRFWTADHPDTQRAREVRLAGDRLAFTLDASMLGMLQVELRRRFDRVDGGGLRTDGETVALAGWKRPAPKDGAGRGGRGGRGEGAAAARGPDPADDLVETPRAMGQSEAWRVARPARPAALVVRNATIWTAGPQGVLENADLLVRDGRIAAVGRGLRAPANAVVVDGTGRHVAPGIIDEHSHAAILGNVNECTNSVTAEVRIADVVNSESIHIYRQLAGGTTMQHLLHGSCNAIGGQAALVKNRWGEAPERLLFEAATPTIKFALGENPKQSNWEQRTARYPASRAGVEQMIRDAFLRARDYRAAQAEHREGRRPLPPRRDLQLEAVAEILEGRRLIHAHSYRQDEILMLMRLAESFGFRVGTFTHILEGYKAADELAAHGASAMGFSDWWAYKHEVIDAIPWNGYLLWDRGVNAGFNSDDANLSRRLNTEAGKAVKYGPMPPAEAIKLVTLNPAKALRVDHRVGSLEPGKDADFAIWNGPPLSQYARVEQTWVDGRLAFDRAADLAARPAFAAEREALLARARAAKKEGSPPGGRGAWPPRYLEETDQSGNHCGGGDVHGDGFVSEFLRRALRAGEAAR